MKIRTTSLSVMALSALFLSACSTADMKAIVGQGDAVSTSKVHLKPTRVEQVKVYSQSQLPKHYRVIGRVSAQNYNIVGLTMSQSSILNELKKQAASLGATGISNLSTGLAQTTAEAIVVK